MQNRHLFRENALKRLDSAEEIQASLIILKPAAWFWLLLASLLIASIFIWSIYGRLTMTISSPGILLPAKQLNYIEQIMKENMHDRKQRLSQLKKILDDKRVLYKQHYLSIMDMQRAEEEYLAAKTDLLNTSHVLNPYAQQSLFSYPAADKNDDYFALVFIGNKEGKKIRKDMQALILPNNLSPYEYGYIKGSVIAISRYPISRDIAYYYLGNSSLVDEYFANGAPFIVKIKLDKKQAAQFAWSSNRSPPFSIDSGSTVTVKIINKNASPINYLFHSEYES